MLFKKEFSKYFKRLYNTDDTPKNTMNRSKSKLKNNSKRCQPGEEAPVSAATSTTCIK